ncbi:MAG TPA: quinoprotein dehydrogenase-associated putative ABC transporter substrate-binding protein [Steroidobacteraceae bacterium]|jgi:quinoprotein dehydrogenase-associated probable ABC transporter substrate-binding protein|nr:quinoprotein dehydrogenase-associated putative ABC transporter substrate-binding protein [Steroidobacteraceae bacterium]
MITWRAGRAALLSGLLAGSSLAGGAVFASEMKSLTVCADPGNMPLSNQKGEGFENKIAQVIGAALGTGVQYYWRPSIERGLMRTTLSEGNCDLWMDMATDTEGAVVLAPLYRSTFVLAYRSDLGLDIKSLDDPALKKLRVGVFQVSAIRQALADHHVVSNTVVHYLSHNADIVANNQPSYQVQQVIDGGLDIAAAWGPMAGYYKAMLHAPLIIQPVNTMEDREQLEFDMALAVPRGRPDIKAAIEQAVEQHKGEIRQVLVDFGVPLVKCDECAISGDLPAHGAYEPAKPDVQTAAIDAKARAARMADLKKWLAQGANPDDELNNAIVADDIDRVRYLLAHGAHVDAVDGEGHPALADASRFGFIAVATYLVEHKADPNRADRSGWTPLMYAAWNDQPALVKMLLAHGASLSAADSDGLTALAVAVQNAKVKAALTLMEAGADVNAPVAKGGYTPLMLASISGSSEVAASLIERGAKVNAANSGGVTALMIAAAGNRSSVVGLLLKSGADVNARSEDGRTALSIAQANNSDAVIKILREAAEREASKSG